MKNLITSILILFSISSYSQHLIGKSTQELLKIGFIKTNDSTYIAIWEEHDINTWVRNNVVIVEQYIIYDQEELSELKRSLNGLYYLADIDNNDMYFVNKNTGVTCILRENIFTLYFKKL